MATFKRPNRLSQSSVLLAALLGLQCAAGGPRPTTQAQPDGGAGGWVLPAASLDTQRLFRVGYEGQQGRAGMKLVLKLASESRFQVSTVDALGRPLWSLQASEVEILLLDHRRRVFCAGEDLSLPDPVLEAMPWPSLPRVLLGYLPMLPDTISQSSAEELDFQSADRRRWTVRLGAGRPISWVLWDEDRPVLWWRRQGDGGMLSHRQGVQIKWREVVSEPLREPLADLPIPAGYRAGECDASHLP